MTDPIADMLTRINNAQAVKKETVSVPFSRIKNELARVMKQSGLISDFEKKGRAAGGRKLELKLKYVSGGEVPLGRAIRISKPSRRVYLKYREMFPQKGVLKIISTSRGIMSDKEARKMKLGGEVLCEIA